MVKIPTKREQISKTTSNMMMTVSIAMSVTVFSLVISKALFNQAGYQQRLINARHAAVKQLKANQQATQTLLTQYNSIFENTDPANVIGGKNVTGSNVSPPDGDNARIVLDALPTTYDFPGLISSVAKIMNADGIGSPTISGKDETANADNKPAATPQPIAIKLTVSGQGSYANVQTFIHDIERSIRPFDLKTIQLNGTSATMNVSFDVTTYYQPAKALETGTKKVQ